MRQAGPDGDLSIAIGPGLLYSHSPIEPKGTPRRAAHCEANGSWWTVWWAHRRLTYSAWPSQRATLPRRSWFLEPKIAVVLGSGSRRGCRGGSPAGRGRRPAVHPGRRPTARR